MDLEHQLFNSLSQTDGRTDGRTDRRTDGQTDRAWGCECVRSPECAGMRLVSVLLSRSQSSRSPDWLPDSTVFPSQQKHLGRRFKWSQKHTPDQLKNTELSAKPIKKCALVCGASGERDGTSSPPRLVLMTSRCPSGRLWPWGSSRPRCSGRVCCLRRRRSTRVQGAKI
jgi:hypothetical protein